jgi:hypothetical protein
MKFQTSNSLTRQPGDTPTTKEKSYDALNRVPRPPFFVPESDGVLNETALFAQHKFSPVPPCGAETKKIHDEKNHVS